MSLSGLVRVNTHYTRSINMERDVGSLSVVDAYIPTTRALRTLDTMVEAFKVDESPRAWSLSGPYGSGKSSFAVFLAHLLSDPSDSATKAAMKKLRGVDAELARKYTTLNKSTSGYCTVLLTGSPESLARRLIESLAQAADEVWANKRGRAPAIIQRLRLIAECKDVPTTSEILECIEELQAALARIGHTGLLIIIDELGKFLEYEARHYGANDIFLLQALAEHALMEHETKLSLVVTLHQAFEKYARGLGESLRHEWAKVQGRFENIPFLESAEQVLHVVAAAIEHDFSENDQDNVSLAASRIAKVLAKSKALPGPMDESIAADLFARCYPLHPVSALLLPLLCQKVAQNERTLFSYLGSREAHGFQDGISRCQKVGDWIYPWEIYEYFILNQSASLSDHFTHRRWAEVVTAIERLGDAQGGEGHVLKAVGLLNIIGSQGNFKASKDIVRLCLPKKVEVDRAIKSLSEKSIIQYRKFSGEHRVWQGSDFDVDANVELELGKLGRFGLAESLNKRHSLMPIVARKYSIQSGALRYFNPTFVDSQTLHQLSQSVAYARIVFYLAESKDDADIFMEKLLDANAMLDIRVLCPNSDQLREAVAEVLALEEIQKTAQELNSDPVAQRESKDRYNAAAAKEEDLLDSLTSEPQLNQWYWKIKTLSVESKRSLQEELSRVLNTVYSKSPIFKNELINRDKPSAQANAAKNKLAIAMFNNEGEPDLGIDKFPAEKAIYRACLREAKLHILGDDGNWVFRGPKSARKSDDPYNIYPVWRRIDRFLEGTEQRAKSLIELNQELMAPPYGIKEGMLPILYLAVLMANQQELAIYENHIYSPYLSEEQIERFLKRPDEFTVQRFIVDDEAIHIYNVYRPACPGETKCQGMLAVAHLISSLVNALPPIARITSSRLSKEAVMVRDAILSAVNLKELVLFTLPSILGTNGARIFYGDNKAVKTFQYDLSRIFSELVDLAENVKAELSAEIASAFGYRRDLSLSQLRLELQRFCGLDSLFGSNNDVSAFIFRLKKEPKEIDAWFEGILTFIGQRPIAKWSDKTLFITQQRIQELAAKVLALETHYFGDLPATSSASCTDVYILELITKNRLPFSRKVVVKDNMRVEVDSIKDKLRSILKMGAQENDERLAILAEVVSELPSESIKDCHGLV